MRATVKVSVVGWLEDKIQTGEGQRVKKKDELMSLSSTFFQIVLFYFIFDS